MTRDQVLSQLRHLRTQHGLELESIKVSWLVVRGEEWQRLEARSAALEEVLESLSIAIELVRNARSDNLMFKD
jgi:hypothetical protein